MVAFVTMVKRFALADTTNGAEKAGGGEPHFWLCSVARLGWVSLD
jgi:hypothetical protein